MKPQVVTKAAFGRLIKVSKARVSQYVGLGLPVCSDGRLDLPEALRWVEENIMPKVPAGDDGAMTEAELEKLLDG